MPILLRIKVGALAVVKRATELLHTGDMACEMSAAYLLWWRPVPSKRHRVSFDNSARK